MYFSNNIFPQSATCDDLGTVSIEGVDVRDIVATFGSPVMIYSREDIAKATDHFVDVFDRVFYASKAAPIIGLERVIFEHGAGCDVSSVGELETALRAGCDPDNIIVHGNAKSNELIHRSLEVGVLRIVIEDEDECTRIEEAARTLQVDHVDVQLRITPGIEAHTHEYLKTGAIDSKFGSAIELGIAMNMCERIVDSDILQLRGFHCHIGSQIFDTEPLAQAARVIITFYANTREHFRQKNMEFVIQEINVGGGFGIQYVLNDDPPAPIAMAQAVRNAAHEMCVEHSLKEVELWVEPGRALVGQAGITAYRVCSKKEIPGVRKYIAVDGGMSDNIRPSLYGADHLVWVDSRDDSQTEIVSIAGMHCEEGDILAKHVEVPVGVVHDDIVLMASTGAYSWAMQSNYNMVRRPCVVLVNGPDVESVREIVRRETVEDLLGRMS